MGETDAETEMTARRAAILAGGRGSRIGAPKATVLLSGRPLASYPADAASAAGLEPFLVAKSGTPLPDLGIEVVAEPDEPVHPLAGIVAALEHANAPVIVLACDLPFLPPALLAALATRPEPLVVPADPRPQPLVARWSPDLLPQLRSALATESPLGRVVAELGATALTAADLAPFGPPERIFANVNDREDLARAEESLAR